MEPSPIATSRRRQGADAAGGGWTPFGRYVFIRTVLGFVVRLFTRVEVEGLERLPSTPVVLCFSHLNWIDPFYLVSVLPERPRVYFFGPEQEDMTHGFRNRLIRWSGVSVPYKPGKRGLVTATHRVEEIVRRRGSIAVAGEGRIHAGEPDLLPLNDGAAYFALRLGVPIVPLAINGTGWLGFRRSVRIRVGEPIELPVSGARRATPASVATLSCLAWTALHDLVKDYPDQPKPGRFWAWLTDVFNDWPEGSREAAEAARVGREPDGNRTPVL